MMKPSRSLLQGDTRLLWIQGGPGKGKTMLSIYLTQHLELMHKAVFFFCQADDEMRRSATHVMRSLIWQLAVQYPACACHLPPYLHPPQDKQAVLDSRESLWSLFKKMTDDLRPSVIFCLLDGLDECDDDSRQWLVTKVMGIKTLPVVQGPVLKLAASSTMQHFTGQNMRDCRATASSNYSLRHPCSSRRDPVYETDGGHTLLKVPVSTR
jgi:hypothetical protein